MTSLAYQQWCEEAGIKLGPIKAAYVQHGWRGVVCTQNLSAGDMLLEVPESLLISRRSAEACRHLGPLLRSPQYAQLKPYQVLAVHLLHLVSEANTSMPDGGTAVSSQGASNESHLVRDGRWWSPYLKELPRAYTSLYCFNAEAELPELQVPYARDVGAAAISKVEQEWREAGALMEALGLPRKFCSLGAWRWAYSTLLSRAMYVPWDTAGALMPFGDLHNYQPPSTPPHTPDILHPPPTPVPPTTATRQVDELPVTALTLQPDCAGVSEATDVPAAASGAGSRASGDSVLPSTVLNTSTEAQSNPEADAAHSTSGAGALMQVEDDGDAAAHGYCGSLDKGHEAGVTERQAEAQAGADISGEGSYDAATGTYKLYARRSYTAGDEVYLCYGIYDNLGLLETYGFLLPDNPHDTAQLPLALVEAVCNSSVGIIGGMSAGRAGGGGRHKGGGKDPFAVLVAIAAGDEEATAAVFTSSKPRLPDWLVQEDCFVHANGEPSWKLLNALRFAAATPAELRYQPNRRRIASGDRVSLLGDLQAVTWLRDACTAVLKSLPTSIAQDDQWLSQHRTPAAQGELTGSAEQRPEGGSDAAQSARGQWPAEPGCLELAVLWRLGYKRILANTLQLADSMIQTLQQQIQRQGLQPARKR